MVKSHIITIGDEILSGHIADTNAKWLSEKLYSIGVNTSKRITISDDKKQIKKTLKLSINSSDIIIVTGGLGPTNDDITKKTLCEVYGSTLIENKESLDNISKIFKKRGLELTKKNIEQALVPDKCKVLNNEFGTAPGMAFYEDNTLLISLPGVPYEMKSLFEDKCISHIKQKFKLPYIYQKTIKTTGIGESWLSDIIKDWENEIEEGIKLAYLPSLGRVKLRLTGKGENIDELKKKIENQVKKVLPLIKKYVFGYDDDELEDVIGKILSKKNKTISVAESCSGGNVSKTITALPGSSNYFIGGIVAYSNKVKVDELKIGRELIERNGAVSKEVVEKMAEGIRKKFKSDIGLSTSGIAGPSGGTPEKPVGTVWIGYSDNKVTKSKKLNLTERRDLNIILTTVNLLNLLRLSLKGD